MISEKNIAAECNKENIELRASNFNCVMPSRHASFPVGACHHDKSNAYLTTMQPIFYTFRLVSSSTPVYSAK